MQLSMLISPHCVDFNGMPPTGVHGHSREDIEEIHDYPFPQKKKKKKKNYVRNNEEELDSRR